MIWTTYVTLETLTNLHINNTSGIGLIYDELDALISGRNQYKGKGDDGEDCILQPTGGVGVVSGACGRNRM